MALMLQREVILQRLPLRWAAGRLLLLLQEAGVPCRQWEPSLGLRLAHRAVSALAVWQKLLLAVVRAQ